MEVSGTTFSERDVKMAKRIIGLLSAGTFSLSAKQVIEAAEAQLWLSREHVPKLEENIFEIKRILKGPEAESALANSMASEG